MTADHLNLELPSGPFDVIVIDPPWSYGAKNQRSSAEKHYVTLATPAEIVAAAPIHEVSAPAAVCYLWVTNPKLRLGFEVLDLYGFTYKTTLTWVKVTKSGKPHIGMGFFYRGCTEHVLLGTRGGYKIPAELRQPNVLHARRGRHSEKPQAFYDMVEKSSPNQSRLDVFARKSRSGWKAWGDELYRLQVPEEETDDWR